MTVTINGTTGIDKVQDGSIQAADLASGVPSRSQLPAGTVLQVVQGTPYATESLINSTSVWTTLSSVSITPTSATSKIFVVGQFIGQTTGSGNMRWQGALYRDSTQITSGVVGPLSASGSGGAYQIAQQYLDSPASSSSITYAVKVKCYDASFSFYVCPNNAVNPCTITVMEIAA